MQQQPARPVSFSPAPTNALNASNKPQIHFSPAKSPISNINFTASSPPLIHIPASADRRNASPIAMHRNDHVEARPLSPMPAVPPPQIKIVFDHKQAQSPKNTKVSITYNNNNAPPGQQQQQQYSQSPAINYQPPPFHPNLPRSVSQPSLRPLSSLARIESGNNNNFIGHPFVT